MSTVTESRGVHYSAEAAGTHGALRCHVTRGMSDDERGARFTVFVSNDSIEDAHALAFVFFDSPEARRRTIVQTIIGPHSDFSTSVILDCTNAGQIPEVHVALSNGQTEFTLVVPRAHPDVALPAPRALDAGTGGESGSGPAAGRTAPAALVSRSGSPAHLAATHVATPVLAAASASPEVRPPPRPVKPPSPPVPASPPVGPMLALFAAIVGLAVYLIARPQIPELHVPLTATPGGSLAVTYRATGVGTADYAVVGPDGVPIGRGALVIGAGLFSVNLPPASAAQAFLVRLRVANLLGTAVAEEYVHVPAAPPEPAPASPRTRSAPSAPPAPPPPQIRSLAVDRATVAGGETLTVYYDVAAASGSIVLLDPAAQITYGRQPLSAAGHSSFVAPHVDATRLLTVLTTVKRGKAETQSRIGVTVTPSASGDDGVPPAGAGLAPAVDDAAATGRAAAGSATLTAPARVRSGEPVWVDLRGAGGDAEIVLLDNSGRELDRRELAPGKHSVEFTAPEVGEPTRLVFEATVPQGVGTVTLVRAISVTP